MQQPSVVSPSIHIFLKLSDRAQNLQFEEFGEEPRNAARLHRVSLTCHYFEQGFPPAKIKETLERDHGIKVSRETPYNDLLHAAKLGYLEYKRPVAQKAQERLRKAIGKHCGHLDDLVLSVIHTESAEDVGAASAVVLRNLVEKIALNHAILRIGLADLIRKHDSQKFQRDDGWIPVHIGFAGGRTLESLADRLGGLLLRDLDQIDAEIQNRVVELCGKKKLSPPTDFFRNFRLQLVLHNVGSGFDYQDPSSHPVALLYAMVAGTRLAEGGRTVFRCFSASTYVPEDADNEGVEDTGLAKQAAKDASKLDILVGSAGSIEDEESILRRFYRTPYVEGKHAKTALEYFAAQECRGDYFWQPMDDKGPIQVPKKKGKRRKALCYRPASLITLEKLPQMIAEGTQVVLALGPGGTDEATVDQGPILQAILKHKGPLLTHAIVDVESASSTTRLLTGKDK